MQRFLYGLSFLLTCFWVTPGFSQAKTDSLLINLFSGNATPVFQEVIQHPDRYRLQIMYTQIDRDKHNRPSFRNYYFHVDSTTYFNPASTVKLPLALLALEKLNNLNRPRVTKFTAMQFDSAYRGQTREWTDSTAGSGYPSIAHFIKKAFLVSDNDAYSRMYEFVGQETVNRSLHDKGYRDTRITHRFVRLTPEENRHTNPVRFIKPDGTLLYAQPAAHNKDPFDFSRSVRIGKAYYDARDSLVHEPFDFTGRNNVSLEALHRMLQSVLFPNSVPPKQRFNLRKDDYTFLHQYLSQFPGETNYPKYDTTQYYDSYVKSFFEDSLHHHLPEGIRVFNKLGWAYGFLTDVSYVADYKHRIEYLLSATVYVNSDEILNDDRYDFKTVGRPFMYRLGQLIYQYDLKRARRHAPDLRSFQIPYEKRRNDRRPVIRDVAN